VVPAVERLAKRVKELERQPREGGRELRDQLVGSALNCVVTEVVPDLDARALRALSNDVRQALGDEGIVVLGSAPGGRVHLVANVSPGMIDRVQAGEIVGIAAKVVGGGGGGRDTMAQAGGRDPEKLADAIAAARVAIDRALT
jgi:alanyl-tRNA synthetase